MNTPTELTIRRPDDWHIHLRDGPVLEDVTPITASQYGRAIVMPNLIPPITTAKAASDYRVRILAASKDPTFNPLMTAYLTDSSDASDLTTAFNNGDLAAAKLYPAGATTNSSAGVTAIEKIYPVMEAMAEVGMPLLIHGEVVGDDYDIFDREKIFIDTILTPIRQRFTQLKIVLEHITTLQGAQFVHQHRDNTAATITPHHLMINRSTMFRGGIRPHLYCLPIAKRREHQLALREAATSGNSCYFLGTDSAPHAEHAKLSACGCAGVFNAQTALPCYAQVFDEENALDRLEAFSSLHGPAFYGLPVNENTLTLRKDTAPLQPPPPLGHENIQHFLPDTPVYWRVLEK